jgi:hypothetical protein
VILFIIEAPNDEAMAKFVANNERCPSIQNSGAELEAAGRVHETIGLTWLPRF